MSPRDKRHLEILLQQEKRNWMTPTEVFQKLINYRLWDNENPTGVVRHGRKRRR